MSFLYQINLLAYCLNVFLVRHTSFGVNVNECKLYLNTRCTLSPNTYLGKYAQFMTMRGKHILARAIGFHKENWGEPRIFQR